MIDIDLIMRIIKKKGDDVDFEDKVKGSIKIDKPEFYDELVSQIQKGFNLSSNDLTIIGIEDDEDENNIKNEESYDENKGSCNKYKVILENDSDINVEKDLSPQPGPNQDNIAISDTNDKNNLVNIDFDLENNLLNDEKELKDLFDKTMQDLEANNPNIEVDEPLFKELDEKQSGEHNELYNYFLSNLNEKISEKNEAQKKSFLETIINKFFSIDEEINAKMEELKPNTNTYFGDSKDVLKDLNEMKNNIPLIEDPLKILEPGSKTKIKPANPEPGNPEQVKSEPVKSEPVKSEPVKSEPIKSEPVKPEQVKPEPVKPEQVKPEQVNPEPVNPEKVKPEKVKPEPVNPEPTNPEPVKQEPPTPTKIEPEKIEIKSEKNKYEFKKEEVKECISVKINIKNISNKTISLKDKKIYIKNNSKKEIEVKSDLNIIEEMDNNIEKEIKVELPMTQPIQNSYEYELYIKSNNKEEIITDKPFCFTITIKEEENLNKPVSKEKEDEIYNQLNDEFVVSNFLEEQEVRAKIQEYKGDIEKLKEYVESQI